MRKEKEPQATFALEGLNRLDQVAQHTVLVKKGLSDRLIAEHFRVSEELIKDWAANHKASAMSGIVSQGREADLQGLIARLSRDFRDRRNAAGQPQYF